MLRLSISLCSVPGDCTRHMLCPRHLGLDMSSMHLLVTLSCVALSSTPNGLFARVWLSRRKSRNERCSSRTGEFWLAGMLRTECSERSLVSTSSLVTQGGLQEKQRGADRPR